MSRSACSKPSNSKNTIVVPLPVYRSAPTGWRCRPSAAAAGVSPFPALQWQDRRPRHVVRGVARGFGRTRLTSPRPAAGPRAAAARRRTPARAAAVVVHRHAERLSPRSRRRPRRSAHSSARPPPHRQSRCCRPRHQRVGLLGVVQCRGDLYLTGRRAQVGGGGEQQCQRTVDGDGVVRRRPRPQVGDRKQHEAGGGQRPQPTRMRMASARASAMARRRHRSSSPLHDRCQGLLVCAALVRGHRGGGLDGCRREQVGAAGVDGVLRRGHRRGRGGRCRRWSGGRWVGVVVVEGFSPPLPPHAAVSPPSAITALVPATAARQRTLRDLIVFPIGTVAAGADFCTLQETRNLTDGTLEMERDCWSPESA